MICNNNNYHYLFETYSKMSKHQTYFNTFLLSTLTLMIASASFANIQIETLKELPAIQVEADKDGAKTKTNIITLDTKNKRTETDLRGLLAAEPSINFGGGNGNSQWWTIRGMGQDQINMVVDGASSDAQIFHHEGRFNLDPSLIKIVKVQKGTGSASAGIGINNGTIVAKTIDAQDVLQDGKDWGLKLNAGYASHEYSYGASAFAKAGKFDFLIGGNFIDQSNYKAGKNQGNHFEVSNSALDKQGALAKIGFNANNNHRFVLGHRYEMNKGVRNLREEFDFIQSYLTVSSLTDAQKVNPNYSLGNPTGSTDRSGKPTYYVIDQQGNHIYNTLGNDARYREIKSNQTTLEWKGYNMGFIRRADVDISYIEKTRKENTKPTGIKTWSANVNLDSQVTNNSLLKYGLNYRKQQGYPTSGIITQEKDDIGIYIESINKVGDFTLTGGLRYDKWEFKTNNGSSRSDYNLNPSLSIIWELTPEFSLNANHNYATRSPRFVETLLSGNNNIKIANNAVADRTRNTELGFNYNNYAGLSLDGSYFWATTDNLASIRNRNIITNQGTLKNKGYEINAGYTWNGLKLRTGVAHNKPTLSGATIDNVTTAMPTGRTWTTGMSYQFTQPNLEIGYKGRIVQETAYVNASHTIVKREGYHLHDLYTNWKPFNNDRLNVNFAINNIADKYYKSHSQRAITNAIPSEGRDFRIGFNYTF